MIESGGGATSSAVSGTVANSEPSVAEVPAEASVVPSVETTSIPDYTAPQTVLSDSLAAIETDFAAGKIDEETHQALIALVENFPRHVFEEVNKRLNTIKDEAGHFSESTLRHVLVEKSTYLVPELEQDEGGISLLYDHELDLINFGVSRKSLTNGYPLQHTGNGESEHSYRDYFLFRPEEAITPSLLYAVRHIVFLRHNGFAGIDLSLDELKKAGRISEHLHSKLVQDYYAVERNLLTVYPTDDQLKTLIQRHQKLRQEHYTPEELKGMNEKFGSLLAAAREKQRKGLQEMMEALPFGALLVKATKAMGAISPNVVKAADKASLMEARSQAEKVTTNRFGLADPELAEQKTDNFTRLFVDILPGANQQEKNVGQETAVMLRSMLSDIVIQSLQHFSREFPGITLGGEGAFYSVNSPATFWNEERLEVDVDLSRFSKEPRLRVRNKEQERQVYILDKKRMDQSLEDLTPEGLDIDDKRPFFDPLIDRLERGRADYPPEKYLQLRNQLLITTRIVNSLVEIIATLENGAKDSNHLLESLLTDARRFGGTKENFCDRYLLPVTITNSNAMQVACAAGFWIALPERLLVEASFKQSPFFGGEGSDNLPVPTGDSLISRTFDGIEGPSVFRREIQEKNALFRKKVEAKNPSVEEEMVQRDRKMYSFEALPFSDGERTRREILPPFLTEDYSVVKRSTEPYEPVPLPESEHTPHFRMVTQQPGVFPQEKKINVPCLIHNRPVEVVVFRHNQSKVTLTEFSQTSTGEWTIALPSELQNQPYDVIIYKYEPTPDRVATLDDIMVISSQAIQRLDEVIGLLESQVPLLAQNLAELAVYEDANKNKRLSLQGVEEAILMSSYYDWSYQASPELTLRGFYHQIADFVDPETGMLRLKCAPIGLVKAAIMTHILADHQSIEVSYVPGFAVHSNPNDLTTSEVSAGMAHSAVRIRQGKKEAFLVHTSQPLQDEDAEEVFQGKSIAQLSPEDVIAMAKDFFAAQAGLHEGDLTTLNKDPALRDKVAERKKEIAKNAAEAQQRLWLRKLAQLEEVRKELVTKMEKYTQENELSETLITATYADRKSPLPRFLDLIKNFEKAADALEISKSISDYEAYLVKFMTYLQSQPKAQFGLNNFTKYPAMYELLVESLEKMRKLI